MFRIRFFLSTCLLLLNTLILRYSFGQNLEKLDSFRLISDLELYKDNVYHKLMRCDEIYSNTQLRGFAKSTIARWNNVHANKLLFADGRFLVDLSSSDFLRQEGDKCSRIDKGIILLAAGIDDLLESLSGSSEHIFGLARLLLFITRIKPSMKLESGAEFKTKNRNFQKYSHEIKTKSGLWRVYAFFDKDLDKTKEDDTLPSVVLLDKFKEAPQLELLTSLRLVFSPVERYFANGPMQQQQELTKELVLDPLAIRPSSRCVSSIQRESSLFDLPSTAAVSREKFSFVAEVSYTRRRKAHKQTLFVAYDDLLQVMRLDVKEQLAGSPDSSRSQIINFKTGKLFSILNEEDTDKTQSSSQLDKCIVLRPNLNLATKEKRLDYLLLGEGKFAYLGKARVRGVDALLYARRAPEVPYWLDANTAKSAKGEKGADKPIVEYLTIVYLGNSVERQLLMMEVHRLSATYLTGDMKSVRVFDFQWSLGSAEAANQLPAGLLFSLENRCPPKDSGELEHVKVELLLEAKNVTDKTAIESVESANKRPVALLASLQAFIKLQPNSISGLSSRLIGSEGEQRKGGGPSKSGKSILMSVSFRVASLVSRMASLTFLGRGDYFESSTSWCLEVASFESCHLLASHQHKKTTFGFETYSSKCCISLQGEVVSNLPLPSDGSAFKSSGLNFAMNLSGRMDVYQVQHQKFYPNLPRYEMLTPEESRIGMEGAEFMYLANQQVKFKFQVLKVNYESQKSHIAIKYTKESVPTIGKIDGFGLVELDSHSIRVDSTKQQPVVTLDNCRLFCLANSKCNSYSICTKNEGVTCILSQTELKSPDLVHKLIVKGSQLTTKGASEFEFEFENSSGQLEGLKLIKKATCSIYTKEYKSLFTFQGTYKKNLDYQQIVRVGEVEECAQICAERNLKQVKVAQTGENNSPNESQIENYFCREFAYLAAIETSEKTRAKLNEATSKEEESVQSDGKQTGGGYCFLTSNRKRNKLSFWLELHNYKFNCEMLYEKAKSLSLKSSLIEEDEYFAYNNVRYGRSLSAEAASLLRKRVELGDNFQSSSIAGLSTCASYCLSQIDVWPICKSFDVLVRYSAGREEYVCQLNSISFQEALAKNRTDLIETSKRDHLKQYWHFEPHSGLALANSQATQTIEQLAEEKSASQPFRIEGIGIVLATLFGIVFGVLVGVQLAGQFAYLLRGQVRKESLDRVPVIGSPNGQVDATIDEL